LGGGAEEGVCARSGSVQVAPSVSPVGVEIVGRERPELRGLGDDLFYREVLVFFGFEDVDFGCAAAAGGAGSRVVFAGACAGTANAR
jgi:hypothetical protein